MKKEKLHYLLTRYLQQRSDKKEVAELKALLEETSDNECEEVLLEIWNGDRYKMSFPSPVQFRSMVDAVRQRTVTVVKEKQRENSRPFITRFGRMAAAIFIAVFVGYTVYMNRSLNELKKYQDKEISMSVAAGQQARIMLPDGTAVRLNSESTLIYPQFFGNIRRNVTLNGEAYFEVARDESRPFTVHTPYLDIEVLGTVFNVYAYSDAEKEEMTLFSGSVLARSVLDPERSVLVKPNQKVACNKQTGSLDVVNVDPVYETAWLTGDLVFRSEKLVDVFRKLERCYDVSITFSGDTTLLDDKFTGRIGAQNITEVMDILRIHYSFSYSQKGKDIMLFCKK